MLWVLQFCLHRIWKRQNCLMQMTLINLWRIQRNLSTLAFLCQNTRLGKNRFIISSIYYHITCWKKYSINYDFVGKTSFKNLCKKNIFRVRNTQCRKRKNFRVFFTYVITFRKKPCSTRILEILTYLNNKTKQKRERQCTKKFKTFLTKSSQLTPWNDTRKLSFFKTQKKG